MATRQPRLRMALSFALLLLLSATTTRTDAVHVHPRHCGGEVHHVHLAVGPLPSTSMTVSFASIRCRYEAPFAGVLWGTSPSHLEHLTLEDRTSSPTSYNLTVRPRMANDDTGDYYFSPFYHHVTLYELEAQTVYYYKPVLVHRESDFDELRGVTTRQSPLEPAAPWVDPKREKLQQADKETPREAAEETNASLLERENNRRMLLEQEEQEERELSFATSWNPYDGHERPCPLTSKIRNFRTAPAPGPDQPLRLAMIGDLGQFPHSEEVLQHMLSRSLSVSSTNRFDHLILAGDIAYTQEDHRRWDTFFDFLDDFPIAHHVPMQICPGNHDIDKIKANTEIFLAYEHRFRMPRIHPPMLGVYDDETGGLSMDNPPYPLNYEWGNAYYSYSSGPGFFIMVSAYSNMDPGSIQYEWIVSELLSVDRNVTPWVIVVIHTPLYNTFGLHRHDRQIVAARKHLEPVFIEHGVNFVFSGHIHAYQRTHAVMNNVLDPKGPVHIVIGAGGRKAEAPFKNATAEEWVAVRDATLYGYGILVLENATTATWDWVHTGRHDRQEEEPRDFNQVYRSNVTLPAGPGRDQVVYVNPHYVTTTP